MKKYTQKTWNSIKKWWGARSKRTKIFLPLLVVIILFFAIKGGNKDTGAVVETVKRQTITRTVIASGKVVSSTNLSLGFEVSDTIKSVNVKVGDKVKKGAILATLNSGEERAAYTSAQGSLLSAQAKYKKTLEGASSEEVALAQVNLNNAAKDLETTKKIQDGLVTSAHQKLLSDGLVAEPTNSVFSSYAPTISGTYTGGEGEYILNLGTSGGDYVTFSGVETGKTKFDTTIIRPLGTKGLSIIFPAGTVATQGGSWKVALPNKASSTYTTNLNAYNQSLDTRDGAIADAEAVLAERQAELNLKKASARKPDIDSAYADVVSAQAQVESAAAKLEKKTMRAPSDGTITKVDIKVGEITTPQAEAIVLQDIDHVYLEANIGEVNIGNIIPDQNVTVSYDAFPGQTYTAKVSTIDPSATENGTVINYKIKALVTEITGIRPGMTANMSIVTAEIPGVLALPGRAVHKDDAGSYVEVLTDPTSRKQKTVRTGVTTGIKGDGDIVEIKSGLTEGQSVLWIPEI